MEFRPPLPKSDADDSGASSNHPIGDADAVGEPNDVGGRATAGDTPLVKRLASGSAVGCLSYKKTGHQPTSIDECGQLFPTSFVMNIQLSAKNGTTHHSSPLADWYVVRI